MRTAERALRVTTGSPTAIASPERWLITLTTPSIGARSVSGLNSASVRRSFSSCTAIDACNTSCGLGGLEAEPAVSS